MSQQDAVKYLDIVQTACRAMIPDHATRMFPYGLKTYIDAELPAFCENMVVTMMTTFAAENIKDVHVDYPLNWWEAVKERFAPAWFTRRYPVLYHHVCVDIKAIWAGYQPPPGSKKYGPFLPYHLETYRSDDV